MLCVGKTLSRIAIPPSSQTAISTQALPEASENEDLIHFNSDKSGPSHRSPAISRIRSLDFLGFNATCSAKSSRRRKLASCVGESKKTAPMGESTWTVSRCGFVAETYIIV